MQQMESDRTIIQANSPSQFQNTPYPQYPHLPAQSPNPAVIPNASTAPYYDPNAHYPVIMTEALMKQLTQDQVQPQIIETFEMPHPWYHKIMMAPLCLFVGCCFSRTSKFQFNNQTRQLKIMSHYGYFCCCEQTETLEYADIINIKYRLNNNRGSSVYQMYLQSTRGQSQLAIYLHEPQFGDYMRGLMKVMIRCGISFK